MALQRSALLLRRRAYKQIIHHPLFGAPIAVIIGAITPTVRAQVAPAIIGGLRAFQFFPTDQLVYNQGRSEDNVSGHGTIAYEFTDTFNAYAKYSRGFKAGGFNLSAGSRLGSRAFRPEEIEAFEIGIKAKLFDNRVRVSSSIFDQQLNDFQANIFNGATFDLNNAGKVSIRGIEWDILAQPTDELSVTFGGTFLDHEYAEFDNGPCAPLAGSSGCTGQPVSFVSDLILTSTGTYTMPIGESFEGFVRADARYLGNHFSKGDLIAISAQPNTITVGRKRRYWVMRTEIGIYPFGAAIFSMKNIYKASLVLLVSPEVLTAIPTTHRLMV